MTKLIVFAFLCICPSAAWAGFTIGHLDTDPAIIPETWIAKAKSDLHIAYNHTSHGSQIITGMNAIKNFPVFGSRYSWQDTSTGDETALSLDDRGIPGTPDLSQGDKDSGWNDEFGNDIDQWAVDTYNFLVKEENFHINIIMWSWCNIAGHNIPRYLNSMEWLIRQFGHEGSHPRAAEHPVDFVFMTAHANGGGEGDSSDSRNALIRQHCLEHDRILFDFSDIENYDPDGNYFLDRLLNDALYYDSTGDGKRDANWAAEYLENHSGSELELLVHGTDDYSGCASCAHSGYAKADETLNCVLKGRAAWSLFARLAGWEGPDGCVLDFEPDGDHDGLDLEKLARSCNGICIDDFSAVFGK